MVHNCTACKRRQSASLGFLTNVFIQSLDPDCQDFRVGIPAHVSHPAVLPSLLRLSQWEAPMPQAIPFEHRHFPPALGSSSATLVAVAHQPADQVPARPPIDRSLQSWQRLGRGGERWRRSGRGGVYPHLSASDVGRRILVEGGDGEECSISSEGDGRQPIVRRVGYGRRSSGCGGFSLSSCSFTERSMELCCLRSPADIDELVWPFQLLGACGRA